jgi:formate hydrogenlyase subunit 6/NADH:ubiquinone oxidoreductase subunit I
VPGRSGQVIEMKFGMLFEVTRNLFSRPMTVRFPWQSIPIPDGYRGEQIFNIDECTSCGLCFRICPNRAIEMVAAPHEYKDKYSKEYPRIDLGKCCFCGLCQDICPKGSITLTKNVFLSTFDPNSVIKDPLPLGAVESSE